MAQKTVLVIGANRGIGLNLLKAFSSKGWNIYGSIRPSTVGDGSEKDLEATGAKILEVDFVDESTILKAAQEYGSGPLDVLINCGGVPVHPEKFLDHTAEMLMDRLRIMAIGPFLTSKHFLPNLQKSPNGKIINITSDFGSISKNHRGGFLGYRMAKSALNQETVTLAYELKKQGSNIAVAAINPGFVATRLTDWDFDDDMDTCIAGILNVVENLTIETTGCFKNWNGDDHAF